jgi:hypothetical protein
LIDLGQSDRIEVHGMRVAAGLGMWHLISSFDEQVDDEALFSAPREELLKSGAAAPDFATRVARWPDPAAAIGGPEPPRGTRQRPYELRR